MTITNLSEDAHADGVGAKRHHLEVETYTWEVLPGAGAPNIIEGFTRELLATKKLLWN